MSRLPNLLIIGVFKAGTTSLFHYLNQHPQICGAIKKETHFFSPVVFKNEDVTDLDAYKEFFKNCDNGKYVLEATPSYLYGGRKLAPYFKNNLPTDQKLILVLRNPADRLISYYKFKKSHNTLPQHESLSVFLDKCIEQNDGNYELKKGAYVNAIKEGLYADYLQDWLDIYTSKNLLICFVEDLLKPQALLINITKWLDIDSSFYENFNFTIENKTVIPKYHSIHKYFLQLNKKYESFFRKNPVIKKNLRSFYYLFNKSEQKNSVGDDVTSKLNTIYYEPNKKLKQMLKTFGVDKLPAWINK